MQYTVVLFREPEGGYTVDVPALSGCVTYGENLTDALDMARDAIELYLRSLRDEDEPVPPDTEEVTVSLEGQQEAMVVRLRLEEARQVA